MRRPYVVPGAGWCCSCGNGPERTARAAVAACPRCRAARSAQLRGAAALAVGVLAAGALLAVCLRAAGTVWALPLAVLCVAAVYTFDRLLGR